MGEWIWLLWDLAAVALIAWFVWRSAARGLLRTVIVFGGYLLAAAAARTASPILARMAYDNLVRDLMVESLMRRLEGLIGQGSAALAAEQMEGIPFGLPDLIDPELFGTGEWMSEAELLTAVENIMDAALREPILFLLQSVLFLALFSLIALGVRVLSHMFGGVNRIPVVGAVNTWLGGLLGVLEAALVLFVVALALRLVLTASGGFAWLSEEIVAETYVLRYFYNLSIW